MNWNSFRHFRQGPLLVGSLFFGLFLVLPVHAQTTIDFENQVDGTSITTQYAGVTFTNATVVTAGISLNELDFPPHSGTNAVIDDGGPIIGSFSGSTSDFGGYFTYASPVTLYAYDASNSLLGSVTSAYSANYTSSGMGAPNEYLSLSFANIASFMIEGDPGGTSFILDDFTFTPNATAAPEPSGIFVVVLFGGVAICLGVCAQRKKSRDQQSA